MPPAPRPLFECSICHGTFIDPQRDGTTYFHQCPPLSLPECLALPLPQLLALLPQLPPAPTPADIAAALAQTTVARPGARDENIDPSYKGQTVAPGGTVDDTLAPKIADNGNRIPRGIV